MGDYTQLHLNVNLRRNTPDYVINAIKYMLDDSHKVKEDIRFSNHPLFETDRWKWMLLGDCYYFQGSTASKLSEPEHDWEDYYLTVNSNFKNYCNEIDLFLDFISPYIDQEGFLGYQRYNGVDDPTLIYYRGKIIKYKTNIDIDEQTVKRLE